MFATINHLFICTIFTSNLATSITQTEDDPDLPHECSQYLVLDDPTRNVEHGWESYCDNPTVQSSPDWKALEIFFHYIF